MGTLDTAHGADAAMEMLDDALQGHALGSRYYVCLPHPIWETTAGMRRRELGWCACVATNGVRLDAVCVVNAGQAPTFALTGLANRIDGAVAFAERHIAKLSEDFVLARAVDAHTRRTAVWLDGGGANPGYFIPLDEVGPFRMFGASDLEVWLAERPPIRALP